jgi:hypothetical protein
MHDAGQGCREWLIMSDKKKYLKSIILLFFGFALSLNMVYAQEDEGETGLAIDMSAENEPLPLPRAFRELTLGMSLDELRAALEADNAFVFRGDRDVSFLPRSNQNLVDSAGFDFIKRAFFQLQDEKVFVMSFTLNPDKVDHYSVFTRFTEKYGQPDYLDPKQSEWENDDTRIYIERPLTVKYIDKTVFDRIVDESRTAESNSLIQKQNFLNDF